MLRLSGLLKLLKMYDVYLHYLSKKWRLSSYQNCKVSIYINCRIYRKCNLTVVQTCLPCRWPSGAQVKRGLVGMLGIIDELIIKQDLVHQIG